MHGYTDYFFHTELADHFADRGFAFYALDLQKCGRSRRDGQTPHFITDLAHYDAELEHALSVIGEQTVPAIPPASWCTAIPPAGSSCRYGWTGCGDATRRRTPGVGGLVLNSPFLDLHGPAVLRLPRPRR